MAQAAREAGVIVVTGDTKVVGRGSADKLFINTSGIGTLPIGLQISGARARPGDAVLCSGTLGDHGMAILSARQELGLEGIIRSDTAALRSLWTASALLASHARWNPPRPLIATMPPFRRACTAAASE